jgi:hypothetical protein
MAILANDEPARRPSFFSKCYHMSVQSAANYLIAACRSPFLMAVQAGGARVSTSSSGKMVHFKTRVSSRAVG